MSGITTQLRLIIAETLLGWILSIAPKDHPDGKRLVVAIADYLKALEKEPMSQAEHYAASVRTLEDARNYDPTKPPKYLSKP